MILVSFFNIYNIWLTKPFYEMNNKYIIMPIDSEFPKNHKVIGKHQHEDGRFHFVWGPGRSDA